MGRGAPILCVKEQMVYSEQQYIYNRAVWDVDFFKRAEYCGTCTLRAMGSNAVLPAAERRADTFIINDGMIFGIIALV